MNKNVLKKISPVYNKFIYNEVPTKLTVTQFQTSNNFVSGTLRVYLNGLREKFVTIDAISIFSLPIDSVTDDSIEVDYVKDE